MEAETPAPRFTLTQGARDVLQGEIGDGALLVSVVVADGGFAYDLEAVDSLPETAVRVHHRPTVGIAYEGRRHLHGATLDAVEGGLVLRNPNRSPGGGDGLESDDETSLQIQVILTDRINPELASHGGSVSLLGHKDRVAYVSMHGGCMGCSMADATMSAGVGRIIVGAVDGIDQVRDVTDHGSGTMPWA